VFYREVGQFKTSYAADMAIFPIRQDWIGIAIILALALVGVPLLASNFFLDVIMVPLLVLSLATIGLNILTGYTGLLSLGTGAFMGVGAFACYKLTSALPDVNILIWIIVAGFFAALAGVLFGLPSLRIKGFYLVVTTLAAQFFLQWVFTRSAWLVNYNASGAIEVPLRTFLYVPLTGATATPLARYYATLGVVIALTLIASNLVHGRVGRNWMAVRDMDIAAELMGIKLLPTKLLAFAASSFYCGVAGAMLVFFWQGSAEPEVFGVEQSFQILFMAIIGGLGSLIGCFLGAALIYILPILLRALFPAIGLTVKPSTVEQLTFVIVGVLIILFLALEPHGLARLWSTAKQKLRTWPFPY
jgi:branched-chain amino acid transport system permease protein